MPYNEGPEQAWMYFENAKEKFDVGRKSAARLDFNMARAIAVKNNMYELIKLIDSYLSRC